MIPKPEHIHVLRNEQELNELLTALIAAHDARAPLAPLWLRVSSNVRSICPSIRVRVGSVACRNIVQRLARRIEAHTLKLLVTYAIYPIANMPATELQIRIDMPIFQTTTLDMER